MNIFKKTKYTFLIISLLSFYALYSFGQMWLFISKQNEPEFYNIITKHSSDWINAHLLLMLSLLLAVPAHVAIKDSLKNTKATVWMDLSIFFISLWAFVLFGQFTIDLCLVEIFSLQPEPSYEMLDKIKENTVIKALFYDNSQLFFLFKFLDLWMLTQICLGTALVVSKKLPKWALVIFFMAMLLCTIGIVIHPVYGRIIKRLGYALFSVAFIPLAISLLKNNMKPAKNNA